MRRTSVVLVPIVLLALLVATVAEARVVRVDVERREAVLEWRYAQSLAIRAESPDRRSGLTDSSPAKDLALAGPHN